MTNQSMRTETTMPCTPEQIAMFCQASRARRTPKAAETLVRSNVNQDEAAILSGEDQDLGAEAWVQILIQ